MQAVLLAGGKGTRLKPFSTIFPKPLVPLDDVPVIEVLVRQLQAHGITDLTVVTGHLAELIRTFLGDGSRLGVRIRYFREDTPLDTAGCLGMLERPDEPFLVMNGDLLTTLNFNHLAAFHRQQHAMATIATYEKSVTIDLGVLQVDGQGQLTEYLEKPKHRFLVSMGIYCFQPEVCDLVEPGEPLAMPDLILRIREQDRRVMAYQEDCYWLDIGRPDDYATAIDQFNRDRGRFLPPRRVA
ncbi:MAG: NTP transferase domain-containing protein [Planctomycetes bacterium]|nr:NTP transferase domain-containing protein [Planctomycetota bacterium]